MLWVIWPAVHVLTLAGIGAVWVTPGIVAVWRAYRDSPSRLGLSLLFGAPLGYAMSSLVLLGAWVAGWQAPVLLVVSPMVALAVATLTPSLGSTLRVPQLTSRDVVGVSLLVVLAMAIIWRPYSQVGIDLPEGRAYRAYFTADFVWAMAVVSEVSKGDVLPANPFHLELPLHYYWLAHLLPALEHRMFGRLVRLDTLLLANATLAAVVFVTFLYGLARHLTRAGPAVLGCMFAILCTSAEGLYALVDLWWHGLPLSLVRYYNIDALSRWVFGTLPVDGLQRLLFYQPQHQLGYALALTGLTVMVQQFARPRVVAAGFAGVAIGAAFLLSTFSALMVSTMVGVVGLCSVARARAWRVGVWQAVAGCVPIGLAVMLSRALHYVAGDGELVMFGLNPLLRQHAATGLVLSFGPAVLAGLPGVLAWTRSAAGRQAMLLPAVVVTVSLAFYFFVDVRDHQDVYVGWRAGHFIFIVAGGLIGHGVDVFAWRGPSSRRRFAAATGFVMAALLGLPTSLIDIYNTQDVANRQLAAGFPWTLVLSRDELQALQWIRTSTPRDARVQVEPTQRDPATWAYIPAFGERRMSAGLPISMIPVEPYRRASHRVRGLYASTDASTFLAEATRLGIDVIVVGREERQAYPALEGMLDAAPDSVRLLYRNRTVSLYGVSERMRRASH